MYRETPFRALVTGIVLLAIGFQAVWLVQVARHFARIDGVDRVLTLLGTLLGTGGSVLAMVLALALVWRLAPRTDSKVLALFMALAGYFLSVNGIRFVRNQFESGSVPYVLLDWTIPFSALMAVAALLRFSGVFPRPLTPIELAAARGPAWLNRVRAATLAPGVAWGIGAAVYLANVGAFVLAHLWERASGVEREAGPIAVPATILSLLLVLMLASLNLHHGYRVADREGRRRIYWIVEGLVVGTGVLVIASLVKLLLMLSGHADPYGWWYSLVSFTALAGMLGCFGIAMFFAGALDPERAVRRTIVYGVLAAVMIFVFAAVEQIGQEILSEWLQLGDRVGGIVTGGVVALTFEPIKNRVSVLIDHWMARFDAVTERTPVAAAAGNVERPTRAAAG